jgi:hypothetical protein
MFIPSNGRSNSHGCCSSVVLILRLPNSSVGFGEHHILQMDGFNMFLSSFNHQFNHQSNHVLITNPSVESMVDKHIEGLYNHQFKRMFFSRPHGSGVGRPARPLLNMILPGGDVADGYGNGFRSAKCIPRFIELRAIYIYILQCIYI